MVGSFRGVKLGWIRGESAEFAGGVFGSLPRRDQRRWGACYLRGLMLDGRRKSIQPMAERLPDGSMQALQQFVNQSPWDPVRLRSARRRPSRHAEPSIPWRGSRSPIVTEQHACPAGVARHDAPRRAVSRTARIPVPSSDQ
ncbi:transposase [Streptomyces sp. NPDC048438]|uniref:transposase n=1 Tax=Streptomyces sp. NPDC048438 TaxID=3365551 RepID=UPI003719A35C